MANRKNFFNESYFSVIDTKDKAYWFGYICADGNVEQPPGNTIGLVSHIKDSSHIKKILRYMDSHGEKLLIIRKNVIGVRFHSKQMHSDLIQLGCVPRKSKIIEFHPFGDRNLNLSFLLGYYDGDGSQGKTTITNGSEVFMEQIKEYFNIQNKISRVTANKPAKITDYDGIVREVMFSGGYTINLGAELFNEMMDNYTDSLPRKRKHFCSNEERIEKSRVGSSTKNDGHRKFEITKEELEQLVWEMPSTQIAKKFGVCDRVIKSRCDRLGITKPPRGYWAKVKSMGLTGVSESSN